MMRCSYILICFVGEGYKLAKQNIWISLATNDEMIESNIYKKRGFDTYLVSAHCHLDILAADQLMSGENRSDLSLLWYICYFDIITYQLVIPHTWHIFYTSTFWGLKILHSKVRKLVTKIASRKNSVIHILCKLHNVCVKLQIACKTTHCE